MGDDGIPHFVAPFVKDLRAVVRRVDAAMSQMNARWFCSAAVMPGRQRIGKPFKRSMRRWPGA